MDIHVMGFGGWRIGEGRSCQLDAESARRLIDDSAAL